MERNAAHETETASDMTLRRDGSWSALPTASHRASGQGATEVAPYGGSAAEHNHADDFESVHTLSLPEVLTLTVDQALVALANLKKVRDKLQILHDLGLGYLTLGEATPALSGGEAQRLKLASEMRRSQDDTLFIFDEPTIGLHPLDVKTLIGVHDSREDILLTAHDLHSSFVGILIELLGELVAAVVVKVGRVDIKDKLAVMGGIRLQAAR